MELRSCNHLHFIQTITNRSTKRVLNVDTHRRTKLRFRHLEDIYKEGPKDEWLPKIQPRAVRELDNFLDMTDSSCMTAVVADDNIKHEPEDSDFESKVSVCIIDGTFDDLGFGDMTLQQIRKQCKVNKRKRQNQRHTENTNCADSSINQEYSTLQPEDEGCELEEPLCRWTTKLSKRQKLKERKLKGGSDPSPAIQNVDFSVSHEIKSEALEDGGLVSEVMTFVQADPLPNCDKLQSASVMDSIEVPRTTTLVEEPIRDEFNELLDTTRQAEVVDNLENAGPENYLSANVSGKETTLVNNSEGTDQQNLDFSSAEPGNRHYADNPISSKTSLESEDTYSDGKKSDLGMEVTDHQIVKVEVQETLSLEFSGLSMVDFEKSHIKSALSYKFSETDCSERNYHLERNQSICSADYSSSSGNQQAQELNKDRTNDGPPSCDLKAAESSCGIEDVATNDSLDASETTATTNQDSSHSDAEDLLSEKRPSASIGNNCESLHSSSLLETDNIQQPKLHRPPENLFSGRKVISPVSQTKLRKAMEQPHSPEKSRCKGKLCFSNENAQRILKKDGQGDNDRTEVSPSTEQTARKPNSFRQRQYQKPALKIPRQNIEAAAPRRFGTSCSTIQGCSQNAIAFSQRQMYDIQNLTNKLTNELGSMIEITEKCLQGEGSPSKLNTDEVRVAIRNAERAEETAKKWLSIMERDCNRFCKLMGMIQDDSSASHNVAHEKIKKKRKITFADDAGGDLCHVKVFEIDLESPSLSDR